MKLLGTGGLTHCLEGLRAYTDPGDGTHDHTIIFRDVGPEGSVKLGIVFDAPGHTAVLDIGKLTDCDVEFGSKWPKAAAKVGNDLDVLLTFFDFPAEHWVHLKTTNPIESTFATVRLRTRVTKGPGSRAAGLAMAFKLIEAAQDRWRAVNGPHLVALVRAGARFDKGVMVERPDDIAEVAA